MSGATERLAQALADLLAEAMAAAPPREPTIPPPDLNVAQLAARLSRSRSCIRGWCEKGRFAGAYKLNGRDWRVPLAGVLAFETAARGQPVAAPTPTAAPSLSAWRGARRPVGRRRRA